MSSTRRRGRSPGSPARGAPSTETQPEVADAQVAEAQSETAQDTVQAFAPDAEPEAPEPVEAAAETVVETAEAAGETLAETSEATVEAVAQPPEAAPAEAQAEPVAPAEEPAPVEATATAEVLVENSVETVAETVESAAEALPVPAVEAPHQDAVEEPAPPAVLPVAAQPAEAGAKPRGFRIGARFAFVPPLEPINEINAALIAFARGEGEAALAHIQALAKAKSPAEAIRLQVSELQRAADASLTCFSSIVRTANRFGEAGRWH